MRPRKAERNTSAGLRFKNALRSERPLQIVGVINAFAAVMAEKTGFKALYLSGAGVANASYGIPDTGLTSLTDVLIDVRRITSITSLPLLVDADTGWDRPGVTVREMIRAGAAAIHFEDQVSAKRCGHLAGKQLVSPREMCKRIQAAVAARTDSNFVIMARTDALAIEGLDAALERARLYRDAGADMIFAEAATELALYKKFAEATGLPILANITEFGKTPLFTLKQLRDARVSLALYPLSAFRAMNAGALKVYRALREKGTQRDTLESMQTRAELYEFLGYQAPTGGKKSAVR
jgi:methylisocitrate lyase